MKINNALHQLKQYFKGCPILDAWYKIDFVTVILSSTFSAQASWILIYNQFSNTANILLTDESVDSIFLPNEITANKQNSPAGCLLLFLLRRPNKHTLMDMLFRWCELIPVLCPLHRALLGRLLFHDPYGLFRPFLLYHLCVCNSSDLTCQSDTLTLTKRHVNFVAVRHFCSSQF